MRNTEEFYRFYRDKMLYKDANPIKLIMHWQSLKNRVSAKL